MKIANKDEFIPKGKYNPHKVQGYFIGNEFGILCVAYASSEQGALDAAVDSGCLNSEIMTDCDYSEYLANGWTDSFTYAGNAAEPIWTEYLWIKPTSERKVRNNANP